MADKSREEFRDVSGVIGSHAPVETRPNGTQFASVNYQYIREGDRDDLHPIWNPRNRNVVVTRDRDNNVSIYAAEYGDDGRTHGNQPFVTAYADGVVITNESPTAVKSPETAQKIRDAVTSWINKGTVGPEQAELAFDFALKAPQMVVNESFSEKQTAPDWTRAVAQVKAITPTDPATAAPKLANDMSKPPSTARGIQ